MNGHLTKKQALDLLQHALHTWQTAPTPLQETLHIEAWYAEHLYTCISQFPLNAEDDLIPYATEKFHQALIQAFKNICKVLDQNQVDGHKIYDIMADERFILRKDRKAYNHQIAGPAPKGLKTEEWESYNHWLLTKIYWDAFVWSREREFEKLLQDAARKENAFGANEIKPLWAMWLKGLEADIPAVGLKDNNISLYPHACIVDYSGRKKKLNPRLI